MDPSPSRSRYPGQSFSIEAYDTKPPFASFLPGIAGEEGIPLWAFYANRGQAICSFGVASKEGGILDFSPANQAWSRVEREGFRTFLVPEGGGQAVEPFCAHNPLARRKMDIDPAGLRLSEESDGLQWEIEYATLPGEPVAGLIRRLRLKNGSSRPLRGLLADGLPRIVPAGIIQFHIKNMSQTAQAWMGARRIEPGIGFFQVSSSLEDSTSVRKIDEVAFYLAVSDRDKGFLPLLLDPAAVFGADLGFGRPMKLETRGPKAAGAAESTSRNVWPCAFSVLGIDLKPGETISLHSLIGRAGSEGCAAGMARRAVDPAWFEEKMDSNAALIDDILSRVDSSTGSPSFDAYARQNWLDNVLRGGLPRLTRASVGNPVIHLYSRKHGDMERDYNSFELPPQRLSSGYGAYRDLNQNRRMDPWFEPGVEDSVLAEFMGLIKADGYNPLTVKGRRFHLSATDRKALGAERPDLSAFLPIKAFAAGEIFGALVDGGMTSAAARDALDLIISRSNPLSHAEYGEGYWVDHWAYNLDMLDELLLLHPEREKEFFFDRKVYTYFDDERRVCPSSRRFFLEEGRVRQGEGVERDPSKAAILAARAEMPNALRMGGEGGSIRLASLFEKLFALACAKAACLDPAGAGLEMEAGKPGWYDALNGLPGLCGSSVADGAALLRLLDLILDILDGYGPLAAGQDLPTEIVEIFSELSAVYASAPGALERWKESLAIRDRFRLKVFGGFSGGLARIGQEAMKAGLSAIRGALDRALRGLMEKDGLLPTYLEHRATRWESLEPSADPHGAVRAWVMPTAFDSRPLPLFLEGQVRALRMISSDSGAKAPVGGVKDPRIAIDRFLEGVEASGLYDRELKMYKVNASLEAEGPDLGRCRAFPPGWLENESIWLHMEYKYLLEILRAGRYRAFWKAAGEALVPFLDAGRYGRSVFENSSFIVSSAYYDEAMRGRGCVARLSGSTAEFLSILRIVSSGTRPFGLDGEGRLRLCLRPIIPPWLAGAGGITEFTFMGKTRLRYHGGLLEGDSQPVPARYELHRQSGESIRIEGPFIPEPWAREARTGAFSRIEVFFS